VQGKTPNDLYREYMEELLAEREMNNQIFIPWEPSATPFMAQLEFLQDTSLTKVARCGNRAAKTFTTMASLRYKIIREHPWNKRWRHDYAISRPKTFWLAGPNFDFLTEVCWKQYLSRLIPRWYYTDDNLNEMISVEKDKEKEYITRVRFRNGDALEFKTYKQAYLAIMGRAIDHLTIDEMPPSLSILVELITRCGDKDGEVEAGFTPLVEVQEIRDWADNHENLSVHQWAIDDNPVYRDNPERLARVLAEWKHLPEPEREARRKGDWYYEDKGQLRIFENVALDVVDDFPIPPWWRQCRIADPASRRTGFIIVAEDPMTGDWYCTVAVEFEWDGQLAKAEHLEEQMDRYRPPGLEYFYSIYDNAEAWFGAYASKGWRACIQKNKELQILAARDLMVDKRLKFFRIGAALAVKQIVNYRRRENGTIIKKKDHTVDCIQYFARQVPPKLTKEQLEKIMSMADWQSDLYKKYRDEKAAKQRGSDRESLARTRSGHLAIGRSVIRGRTRR
jgi:hypothetical protein